MSEMMDLLRVRGKPYKRGKIAEKMAYKRSLSNIVIRPVHVFFAGKIQISLRRNPEGTDIM